MIELQPAQFAIDEMSRFKSRDGGWHGERRWKGMTGHGFMNTRSNIAGGEGIDGREIVGEEAPGITFIVGPEDFSGVGAEIDSGGVEGVHGHAFAINAGIDVFLGQAGGEGLPGVAGVAAAEDAQLALGRTTEFRAFEREGRKWWPGWRG